MGGKQILALILILLFPVLAHADNNWDCKDPDTVLCMDMAETDGGFAYDKGPYANHGVLNGGPARVSQNNSLTNTVRFSSVTSAMFPAQYIRFTRTIGEYVSSPDESRLDFFTGNQPFIVAMTIQLDTMNGADRVIMSYAEGTENVNSSKGWHFRNTGGANLIFGHIGIADFQFNSAIPDLKPHSIVVWDFCNTGLLYEWIDNKLDKIWTGISCGTGGTGHFSITQRNNTGQIKWGGGVAFVRIKKNVLSAQQAKQLAASYHNHVANRYGNQ